ncbi:hypothetical protein GCM10023310_57510 [Paenibacillus vulneris]|uniref:Uncharacterized protein n=1 Tax=Paenibacillus vulneris TaxID=1133364 RepID=A0ABW3UVE3_9BACL|nr:MULTISPECIES: hypothetical protein [unclassified Paenibacillus]MBE1445999.1 hypothetical protein [Paenibacillus sp. OAS669]
MHLSQQDMSAQNKQGPEEEWEEEHFLPPRSTIHPTEKERWLPVFYRTLLWLFILLVIGLLIWGWDYLKKHS